MLREEVCLQALYYRNTAKDGLCSFRPRLAYDHVISFDGTDLL